MNVQYYAVAALSVGLGVNPPGDWPDVFGRWSDAYTVRNFWGKFWHQTFRRIFMSIAGSITHLFGFKRGTNASSYTQLYTAFFLSSIIHGTGDITVGWRYGGKSMPFFLIQAVIITAEDAVIALFCKMGIRQSRWTRLLGYIWVIAWGIYTSSMYMNVALEAGWALSEWPFSPARIVQRAFHSRGEWAFAWD